MLMLMSVIMVLVLVGVYSVLVRGYDIGNGRTFGVGTSVDSGVGSVFCPKCELT